MTNSTTSVMGRSRLKAAKPTKGTSAIRISSVPYAEEEIPSGDSTRSASGLDSRCSPRSWLTSGGPSSFRLVVYQNVSGRLPLSSKPVAFRVATDLRLSSGIPPLGRQRLHTITTRVILTRQPGPGLPGDRRGPLGKKYPLHRPFTRLCQSGRRRNTSRPSREDVTV